MLDVGPWSFNLVTFETEGWTVVLLIWHNSALPYGRLVCPGKGSTIQDFLRLQLLRISATLWVCSLVQEYHHRYDGFPMQRPDCPVFFSTPAGQMLS